MCVRLLEIVMHIVALNFTCTLLLNGKGWAELSYTFLAGVCLAVTSFRSFNDP